MSCNCGGCAFFSKVLIGERFVLRCDYNIKIIENTIWDKDYVPGIDAKKYDSKELCPKLLSNNKTLTELLKKRFKYVSVYFDDFSLDKLIAESFFIKENFSNKTFSFDNDAYYGN